MCAPYDFTGVCFAWRLAVAMVTQSLTARGPLGANDGTPSQDALVFPRSHNELLERLA